MYHAVSGGRHRVPKCGARAMELNVNLCQGGRHCDECVLFPMSSDWQTGVTVPLCSDRQIYDFVTELRYVQDIMCRMFQQEYEIHVIPAS